ncbi:hypothetical protein BC628DRAFT_1414876 [Trametes gibbosa]|nr:hypothetical protein BC628DRAFT_1414876 [Trametes gibbosa]
MFTRVLTRTFLFRRGQHADTSANRDNPVSGSRPSSPESQHLKNILRQSEVVANSRQAQNEGRNDEEIVVQDVAITIESPPNLNDENLPVVHQAEGAELNAVEHVAVDHGCDTSINSAAQDASSSFILIDCSKGAMRPPVVEEDAEEFMTPELDAGLSKEPSSFYSSALAAEPDSTNTLSIPASTADERPVEPTAMELPLSEPSSRSSGEGLPDEYPQSSSAIEPHFLQTCLLSDITEAEEPSISDISCKNTAGHLMVDEECEGIGRVVLSFSPFGSSYASTLLLETSDSLSQELVPTSSALACNKEMTTKDDVAIDSVDSADALPQSANLPPLSVSDIPWSSPRADAVKDSSPSLAIPDRPCCVNSANDASIDVVVAKDAIVATCHKVAADISTMPAPSTYADAMNLAMQFPEMSSKLLSEPLASAYPSVCTTLTRPASPVRHAAHPAATKVSGPVATSVPSATINEKSKKGSTHSSERPDWAQADTVSTSFRPSRTRGRGIAQSSSRSRDVGHKGKHGAPSSNTSQTPFDNTSNTSSRPPASGKAYSREAAPAQNESVNPSHGQEALPKGPVASNILPARQHSPQRSSITETTSARNLRREKAEPWRHRVSSWVEQTSVVEQTSPNTHFTPARSLGTSPVVVPPPSSALELSEKATDSSIARPSITKATDIVVCSAARSISPGLNPHAPVWEFKPHRRATTICQVRSIVDSGASSANPLAAPLSQSPLQFYNPEEDLHRLRAMLRESGLEDRRLNVVPLNQACPMPNFSGPPQLAPGGVAVRPENAQNVPPNSRQGTSQGIVPNPVWTAHGVREGTQTSIIPPHGPQWQCSDGGVLRYPGIAPQFPGLGPQKAPWKYDNGVLRFPGLGQFAGGANTMKSASVSRQPLQTAPDAVKPPPAAAVKPPLVGAAKNPTAPNKPRSSPSEPPSTSTKPLHAPKKPPQTAPKKLPQTAPKKPSPSRAQAKPTPSQPSAKAKHTPPGGSQAPGRPCEVSAPPAAGPRALSSQNPPSSAGQAQKGCQSTVQTGTCPTTTLCTPVSSPAALSVSQQSQPPPANSNATAPTTVVYGIETPRVIYDRHGWTVKH